MNALEQAQADSRHDDFEYGDEKEYPIEEELEDALFFLNALDGVGTPDDIRVAQEDVQRLQAMLTNQGQG